MKSDWLRGALSGCVATVPMTAAMLAWHRRLPLWERYPLPPRQITMNVARRAGIKGHLNARQKTAVTLVAHFSYGAAVGAVYAALSRRLLPAGAASGAFYGVAVWAASYLGLLPALQILTPATDHPARRNALMVAAHVVWGAVTGCLVRSAHHSDAM
jgi:hypothetical protein